MDGVSSDTTMGVSPVWVPTRYVSEHRNSVALVPFSTTDAPVAVYVTDADTPVKHAPGSFVHVTTDDVADGASRATGAGSSSK